ncbi:aldose epimerase [Luteimonas sp. RD2P54]|uniref:Aldose epimerase n=1 Tax=Luteimonas endophytica TaxID=3042023 RepID=A0ABT6J9J6_9GAMM|nr:aldose epimerase [Luteimonas endophytica]MDH5823267.1 aldose epimerase [Luteimonas endophytica]
MAGEAALPGAEPAAPVDDSAAVGLPPGPLLELAAGDLALELAPQAGGRIAQLRHRDAELLVGYGGANTHPIAWGCYPMLPWAGRIRGGRFGFGEREYRLPVEADGHAVHGVGHVMPWRVDRHAATLAELSLELPADARWPFGGVARQRIELAPDRLRMQLSVSAGVLAMPAALGWHPWFRKPERLEFSPVAMYPRDAEGIATAPPVAPGPGPWDDCFLNREPAILELQGRTLRLSSDCAHWVIYDAAAHATCVEPQTGPPDAFNLMPQRLAPGASLEAWFLIELR